jgi:cytochrome c-type biogenesis protein CcmH/NrfF
MSWSQTPGTVPKGTLLAITLLFAVPAAFAQDAPLAPLANEQLTDPRKEANATELMETLRCIQCQGQSIADSDAPIAAAMRAEVRQRVDKGESTDSIRNLMIARYGEWVSFEPRGDGGGLILWLAPLLVLMSAIWFARGLFRRGQ